MLYTFGIFGAVVLCILCGALYTINILYTHMISFKHLTVGVLVIRNQLNNIHTLV